MKELGKHPAAIRPIMSHAGQQETPQMIDRIFLSHPRKVEESYFEHAAFAARFSGRLLLAAGAAAVHAVIPCLFEKTASRITADLYAMTHNRGQ
jgi:hypothetical protein